MNFLVLGCNGMVGSTISLYLKKKGYEVKGFAKEKGRFIDAFVGDVANFDVLDSIIKNGKFDVIINCIGILNQSAEDNKELAVILNTLLPHHLVNLTKDMKSRIFHMSTDCVFSGKRGQYIEDDFKDGESFYDRTKALGELNDSKNLTFRTSIIGPDINENGIGLFNWFMKQTGTINGWSKTIWTGITTLQLAKIIEKVALSKKPITGLMNTVNNAQISKYDMLLLFKKLFSKDNIIINKVDGTSLDKSLIRTNFSLKYKIPGYEKMLKEMNKWVNKYKEYYPHYFK